jgi:hypothetical protein
MIEKRSYPRVARQFSAVVEDGAGVHLNVVALDASGDGLCIQCNIVERNLITPGGCFVRDGKPVELFVWLELPIEEGRPEKIGIRCHVAYSRRISNNQCKIGMRYMGIDKKEQKKLIEYIESATASNDQ